MKNLFSKITLRVRLTLLTTGIIICIAVVLTTTSINRANTLLIKTMPLEAANAVATVTVKPVQSVNSGQMDTVDYTIAATTIIKAKETFALSSTSVMMVVIGFGIVITWFMAGRALRPVQQLKLVVEEINGQNLSTRVAGFQAQDEISQLANSFNQMLDKIEQTVNLQKAFALNAAHEFKTPLAAIRTNLEVIQLDQAPTIEEYQETMTVIGRNTDRLIDLVDDLLQLHAEQVISFQEEIQSQPLLESIQLELAALLKEKNVDLTIINHAPHFYGNYNLMYCGLINLIENGIKYNQCQGWVKVELEHHEQDVVIQVRDNGLGIPQEALPFIFQPFYRVEQSRSRQVGGSGLGLALIKSIIEKHHGTISVYSKEGEGTTFTIILPQHVIVQQDDELGMKLSLTGGM